VILAALLSLAPYSGDRDEAAAARVSRLTIAAESISAVARNRGEVAALIALGRHESNFSALVQAGRCSELHMLHACDNGKARGVWQLHAEACPAAYAFADGSIESIRAEAQCAIRLLRWNAERGREHTLTPLHAAFAGYAAKAWGWSGADERVRTTRAVLARLERSP
jgi:hypothetical protein